MSAEPNEHTLYQFFSCANEKCTWRELAAVDDPEWIAPCPACGSPVEVEVKSIHEIRAMFRATFEEVFGDFLMVYRRVPATRTKLLALWAEHLAALRKIADLIGVEIETRNFDEIGDDEYPEIR